MPLAIPARRIPGAPAGALDTLLLPDHQRDLTSVLLLHALGSEVPSSAVTDGLEATPLLARQTLRFATGATVTVNGVTTTAFDIEANIGTIHLLAGVLLPPG